MAARRERGLLDPNAAEGDLAVRPPRLRHRAATATCEEGVSAEASSLAGTQQLGNLTLIYDANRISIEGDTDVAFTEDVAARYEAYGWHVQTVDWTHDGTELRRGRARRCTPRSAPPRRSPTGPASSCCARSSPGRPRTRRAPAAAHGSALGAEEVAATKKILGFDPEQPSRSPDDVLAHTRSLVARGQEAQAAWEQQFDAWTTQAVGRPRAVRAAAAPAPCPTGWTDALPTFDADPKGVATRKASGAVINALRRRDPRAVGRLGRPRRVQQHHHQGRRRRSCPTERSTEQWSGRPVRPGAALRHPRARHGRDHERHRPARRHPRLRRHVPDLLATTCAARSAWPR